MNCWFFLRKRKMLLNARAEIFFFKENKKWQIESVSER